jgi:hypothetical protein
MGANWTIRPSLLRRGQVTILVGGIIVVFLLLFFVVGMDFARVYYVRGELQSAADAAALAGARQLTGDPSGAFTLAALDTGTNYQQLPARQAAWQFACRNSAAHQNVFLEQMGSCNPVSDTTCCNTPPISGLNEGTNDPAGDIVVGYWSSTPIACSSTGTNEQFCPANGNTGNPINAVKVRDQRVTGLEGSGRGSVGLLFGKLVGWQVMDVRRQAIAMRLALKIIGMPLCLQTCDLTTVSPTTPLDLFLQKDPKTVPIDNGIGWTAFTQTQAPDIGANGDVVKLITGEASPPNAVCDTCVTTNNGLGVALPTLADAFQSTTYEAASKTISGGTVTAWRVAVPVFDHSCDNPCTDPDPSTCACPPGGQGSNIERYHISSIAAIEIISVNTTGSTKGITIDALHCITCGEAGPFGNSAALVK